MNDEFLSEKTMKSLPSQDSVRHLKYDEICVHFSFSVEIRQCKKQ